MNADLIFDLTSKFADEQLELETRCGLGGFDGEVGGGIVGINAGDDLGHGFIPV